MKTVIGNWKMNVGTRESVALARGVLLALRGKKAIPETVVCPPFTALAEVRKIVARTHVALGAQDLFWEDSGAYTGEISARMLAEHGVSHVIVGHSERRALFETDEMAGKKAAAALVAGLTPVICVGETAVERKAESQAVVVKRQLVAALSPLKAKGKDRVLVAYEPVWAIGTGEPATPNDAVAMHAFIRGFIAESFPSLTKRAQVLYGGSVDGTNAYAFLREKEVDGVLVGGASVKMKEFGDVLSAACEVIEKQGV
ncbi:triose-phosphate isomerase [Candidatus Uhrbacteria bacterium RIFCSPHIGHO2_01_FULL_63_20]|uniref:Triosephosphate isomerase n=1 Tax=Candidatus Uhrbacteria bacterium RIFCSPHIGHO2_01_FULL_63_20 TaxID=1802385 RepID=A0A1F7TLE3_9BACT|nr:MAG: triose-phosphate isomerase [Candidatus Uhrbacteria bacterium RIFCSPHIGHO2_01_FULL_63_20]